MSRVSPSRPLTFCTPLFLHRPARNDQDAFWWSDIEVMPYRLVERAPSCFECTQPLLDLEDTQLLAFCQQNEIDTATATTTEQIAKAIAFWQIGIVERLGCHRLTMNQFVEIYDCAKATAKRKSFREDICRLIEMTDEMSLDGLLGNLSLYVLTNFGMQHIVRFELDRTQGSLAGWFYTQTGAVSSFAELPLWMERRPNTDRVLFQAMIEQPQQFWRIRGATGRTKRSAALYELEKILWVLNTRLWGTVVSYPQAPPLLRHELYLVDAKTAAVWLSQHTPQQIIGLGQEQPGERVAMLFLGEPNYVYDAPLGWAGAIALAYFTWAKQMRQTQNGLSLDAPPASEDGAESFTAAVEFASFTVFCKWLDRLAAMVPIPPALQQELTQRDETLELPQLIRTEVLNLFSNI